MCVHLQKKCALMKGETTNREQVVKWRDEEWSRP